VEKVLDRDGKEIPLKEAPCEEAVNSDLAAAMVQGMSHDTNGSGTAAQAASQSGWNRPTLGKTGTTENHHSVAFMGATPQYAGAVMTYADGNQPQSICPNPIRLCGNRDGVYGGMVAAPTWFNAMKVIHESKQLPVAPLPNTSRYR
jgi:membrane peptidoglycan carboxypeptidase